MSGTPVHPGGNADLAAVVFFLAVAAVLLLALAGVIAGARRRVRAYREKYRGHGGSGDGRDGSE